MKMSVCMFLCGANSLDGIVLFVLLMCVCVCCVCVSTRSKANDSVRGKLQTLALWQRTMQPCVNFKLRWSDRPSQANHHTDWQTVRLNCICVCIVYSSKEEKKMLRIRSRASPHSMTNNTNQICYPLTTANTRSRILSAFILNSF